MNPEVLLGQLNNEHFLPLYTATSLDYVETAKNLLLKHNLHFIEVTYRSALASEAIAAFAKTKELIVGAGTVCTLATAKEAIAHGAKFIVTPGYDKEIVRYCLDQQIAIIPGAVTPTEIMQAMKDGLRVVKFFPADIYGGLSAIQSLSGPFFDMKFVPTGGINQGNCMEYIQHPAILAVGGSFILSEHTIKGQPEKAEQTLAQLINKID